MIDPEKLTKFLTDSLENNKAVWRQTSDPYWAGRMTMCTTLMGKISDGSFEEGDDE